MFVGEMCVFLKTSNKNDTFPQKKKLTLKNWVVGFFGKSHIFEKKHGNRSCFVRMFHNSNDKPWKSSRILRVKLAVTCFGQIYFVHDLLLPRPNLATNQRRRNHKKKRKTNSAPHGVRVLVSVCGCWLWVLPQPAPTERQRK